VWTGGIRNGSKRECPRYLVLAESSRRPQRTTRGTLKAPQETGPTDFGKRAKSLPTRRSAQNVSDLFGRGSARIGSACAYVRERRGYALLGRSYIQRDWCCFVGMIATALNGISVDMGWQDGGGQKRTGVGGKPDPGKREGVLN